jgi:hypothetical protein
VRPGIKGVALVRVFRISLAIVGVLLLALAVIIMQTRSAAADTTLTARTLLVAGSGQVYAIETPALRH